ncbi:MAG: lipoate--protein ligase [Chlorobi bacterium]|nr:lipoate--protein ligase [Chlorobiota bacterium]
MNFIDSPYTDPALNLALEEFLLRRDNKTYMLLYVNKPAIIVGKHQNAFREVNLPFIERFGIPVIRRLTGGGTVYHDEGNLNFSFILNGKAGKMVDFGKYIEPVAGYIRSLGVDVETDKRHNLRIRGLKISGNAEHIFKQRVLHHGTLLFSSRLDTLEEAIKPAPGTFTDKAVESAGSRVTNISDYLNIKMTMTGFRKDLMRFCKYFFGEFSEVPETGIPRKDIGKLADEKYRTWDWNFGYSPDFVFGNKGSLQNRPCHIKVAVHKGIMTEVTLDGKGVKDFSYLCSMMKGVPYRKQDVARILRNNTGELAFVGIADEWLSLMFPETAQK